VQGDLEHTGSTAALNGTKTFVTAHRNYSVVITFDLRQGREQPLTSTSMKAVNTGVLTSYSGQLGERNGAQRLPVY